MQSVLITYTEPRLASPQSLLLDLQCGHEKAPPSGPAVTGLLLRAPAARGREEGLELHTASLRKGVPAGDNAGTRPPWLLIDGEGAAHTEGTFESGGQALHPLLQQPCFTVFILEWSFSHAHPQGTHRKCCKVLPPGHHCGEFFYIRDTICLFVCQDRKCLTLNSMYREVGAVRPHAQPARAHGRGRASVYNNLHLQTANTRGHAHTTENCTGNWGVHTVNREQRGARSHSAAGAAGHHTPTRASRTRPAAAPAFRIPSWFCVRG